MAFMVHYYRLYRVFFKDDLLACLNCVVWAVRELLEMGSVFLQKKKEMGNILGCTGHLFLH